jgi:hypothetical protein
VSQSQAFAVAPRMKRLLAFWATFQVVAVFALLRNLNSLGSGVAVVAIGNLVFLIGSFLYYRRMCRLHDDGVVVEAKVIAGRGETIFWVKYPYKGTEYEPRVGLVVDFDSSVRDTLKRAVTEKVPVKLLIDPRKPTRYFILPFETRPARGALEGSGAGKDNGEGSADPAAPADRPRD